MYKRQNLYYEMPENLERSMASKLWAGSFNISVGNDSVKSNLLPVCVDMTYWECKTITTGVDINIEPINAQSVSYTHLEQYVDAG